MGLVWSLTYMSTSSIKEVASILNSHIFGQVVAIDDLLYINMPHWREVCSASANGKHLDLLLKRRVRFWK